MKWIAAAFLLLATGAQAETHIVTQGPLSGALTPAAFTQRFEDSARAVRRPFAQGSAAAEAYGPVREDSVYLVPVALMSDDSQLLCDFSAHRTGFVVSQPVGNPQPSMRAQATPGPDPTADVLRTFMQREYPGFMPDAQP